jgi:thiamine-phosphate pyrophosphorylase
VTRSLSALPFEEAIVACLRGGAAAIQLREKEIGDEEFVRLGRVARDLTRRVGGMLVINDRPEVARACGADGVHLGQEDRDPVSVRREFGPDLLLGCSCHSVEDALDAVRNGADYIGIGPVFETTTKRIDHARGVGLVHEVRRWITLPFFPLGGIDLGNLDAVLEAGAEGVAVCSAVIGSLRMEETARAFATRIAEARSRRRAGESDSPR